MRIVVMGAAPTDLAASLARSLHLPHHIGSGAVPVSAEGFVLDGFPRNREEARQLDARLDAHAAPLDAVLWVRGRAASSSEDAVLGHYRGRVVEVDGPDAGAADGAGDARAESVRGRALEALREALVAMA